MSRNSLPSTWRHDAGSKISDTPGVTGDPSGAWSAPLIPTCRHPPSAHITAAPGRPPGRACGERGSGMVRTPTRGRRACPWPLFPSRQRPFDDPVAQEAIATGWWGSRRRRRLNRERVSVPAVGGRPYGDTSEEVTVAGRARQRPCSAIADGRSWPRSRPVRGFVHVRQRDGERTRVLRPSRWRTPEHAGPTPSVHRAAEPPDDREKSTVRSS